MVIELLRRLKGDKAPCFVALSHLRNMIHNLPFHLSLEREEASFLHDLFAVADQLDHPLRIADVVEPTTRWKSIVERYCGQRISPDDHAILSVDDFDRARDYRSYEDAKMAASALLKIAKCILLTHASKYPPKDVMSFSPLPIEEKPAAETMLDPRELIHIQHMKLLRDMLRGIPPHLNLDQEETKYLHCFFSLLDRLNEPKLLRKYIVGSVDWQLLSLRYIDQYAGVAVVDNVTQGDFDAAHKGDAGAIAKIAKCILFVNFHQYQKCDAWFQRVNSASGFGIKN